MDIKEFAKELSEATKDMSDEQRATVRKMFEKVAD
jgi:formate C-acetyltransferase